MKSGSQAAHRSAAELPDNDPPAEPRRKRSPSDVQRDRLTERIRRLEVERDGAVSEAVREIRENAEADLKERIGKKSAAITARFGERIDPLRKMLGALGSE
jgi:hypothetical protein